MITCRAHTASDVFVTKARPLPKAAIREPGQSTFPMRFTKHLRFQCSKTPSTVRASSLRWRLSTRRGSKVEVEGKRVSPGNLSSWVHPLLSGELDRIPQSHL
jgi:hypothetical protein